MTVAPELGVRSGYYRCCGMQMRADDELSQTSARQKAAAAAYCVPDTGEER